MAKKKRMHIKHYKYHQRPKDREVNVLLYFLEHFDEYVLGILNTVSELVGILGEKVQEIYGQK